MGRLSLQVARAVRTERADDTRRKWSADDEEALRHLYEAGVPIREIARQLGRTPRAIERRVSLMLRAGKLDYRDERGRGKARGAYSLTGAPREHRPRGTLGGHNYSAELNRARRAARITLDELAAELGVPRAAVQNRCLGSAWVGRDEFLRAIDAMQRILRRRAEALALLKSSAE